MSNRSFLGRGSIAALALSALCMAAPAAHAQVPTIDPANIVQTAKSAVSAARQVQQLVQLGQQMYSMGRSIGQGGPMQMLSMGISTAGQLEYIAPRFEGLATQLGGSLNLSATESQAIAMPQATAQTFASPTTASTYLQQAFYSQSNDLTAGALDGLRQRRESNARQAAINAYGLATHSRNAISQSPQIQQLLVQENNATSDMRSDIKANTAVTLQILDRLTHIQALLAADVELAAARSIADDRASGR